MDENKENALETTEEALPAELPKENGEASPAAVEETAEAEGAEEAEEEDGPAPDMIFGMRRRTFHLVVVGYAMGVIVVSLFGLAGLYPEDSGTMIPGVIGAALGYALAAWMDKRDDAKNEEESQKD